VPIDDEKIRGNLDIRVCESSIGRIVLRKPEKVRDHRSSPRLLLFDFLLSSDLDSSRYSAHD
jgi:hypothetical protein